MKRLLITGGAGFVGASLAQSFKVKNRDLKITCFDNLKRRGSELNLLKLKSAGIEFVHGDVRSHSDLFDLEKNYDLIIEASAEPSVHAGVNSSPVYVLDTNLRGAMNCLEFARTKSSAMIFLSTSRVYSIDPLNNILLDEKNSRFEIADKQSIPGVSSNGIAEDFPTDTARSFYGASKLCAEQLIQEYSDQYNLNAVINRCGVIAGPGQFGKVDQGVFTLWVAAHYFSKNLNYTGFGGTGKQVRDLLHPLDLFELIDLQSREMKKYSGDIFNVGGGQAGAISMCELTSLCEEAVGKSIKIGQLNETASVDIPFYVSDHRKVSNLLGWKPTRDPKVVIDDIAQWIRKNEVQLKPLFCD